MTYLVDLVGKILCGACDIVFHFASSTPASTRFMATSTLVGRSFGPILDLSPTRTWSLVIPPSIAASMTCLVFIKAIIMLFEIGTHGYLVLEFTEGKVFRPRA
jgi:hypothetical protein